MNQLDDRVKQLLFDISQGAYVSHLTNPDYDRELHAGKTTYFFAREYGSIEHGTIRRIACPRPLPVTCRFSDGRRLLKFEVGGGQTSFSGSGGRKAANKAW